MDKKIENIIALDKLIKEEPDNDGAYICFICSVLDLIETGGFLTPKGNMMIQQDICEDLLIMTKSPKALTRVSLYFTIANIAGILYLGFVDCLDLDRFKDIIPEDLKECIRSKKDRVDLITGASLKVLKDNIENLSDKYAKIYNEEKMGFFVKDVFKKEGFTSRDTLQMKSSVEEIIKKGQEVKL
jgi:hypothetical protein